ncbi:hypothetical protein ABVK25_009480 [Lepraria finkii]|uniref:Uncharacterized protein n=1 Tax=Lepraria finkii TaxID=1340010 RepID=A0ABR4AYN8_9LECA
MSSNFGFLENSAILRRMRFLNGEVKSLNADWGLFVGHASGVTSRHELKANDDWVWLSTVQTAIRELEPARPLFLIDNAGSVLQHWKEVNELLGLLAYTVKDSNPDGIELYFTIYSDEYKAKTSTKLSDKLEKKSPGGTSNIR